MVRRGGWLVAAIASSSAFAALGDRTEVLPAPLWQLGEFFADAGEFEPMAGEECVYVVEPGVHKQRRVRVPRFLGGPGAEDCRRLRLRFPLNRGCYALVRSLKEPPERAALLCQAFFDGRELACCFTAPLASGARRAGPAAETGKPNDGSQSLPSPPGFQCAAFPFLCLRDGEHELTLSMEAEVNAGQRLELDALALVKWTVAPRPHSLTEETPGRVFLDVWGWQGTVWYQRRGSAGPAYFQEKLIDESAARGANYLQLHPSLDHPNWARAGFDAPRLLRGIHARDMLVDEHCFPGGRKTAEEMLAWLREWAPVSVNGPEREWTESVDGFEGEAFNALFENSARLAEMTDLLWRWNPGLWVSHAGFPVGARWLSEPKDRPPNYVKSPVCLHFLGLELAPPEGKVGTLGYDDKTPVFRPFPGCQGLHPPSGKIYLGYQADCRVEGTEISRRPPRRIGGGSTPDWMLKQVDDFCRPRARTPDDPHETALWWLGEPPETLPLEYRDYVYAVSQDPLKHGVASALAHDGVGGFLDQRREQLRAQAQAQGQDVGPVEWWKLRRRSEFPSQTHFLQNAYLRLNLFPDRDGGVLQYDLERLAHFDSDSLSMALTERLLEGSPQSAIHNPQPGAGSFTQTFDIEQPGGHLAVLRARARRTTPAGGIAEERRYILVNDAPCLVLELARASEGYKGAVELALGAEGYDLLVADGRRYAKAATFQAGALPKVWRLQDASGFKPDLAMLMLAAGRTKTVAWDPARSLTLSGAADDRLQLAWVVPTDLYAAGDLPRLASALQAPILPLRLTKDGATARNVHGAPYVAVARIEDPGEGPYLVQEKGWWTVRGAQRVCGEARDTAERPPCDYLKLYLPTGEAARVLPHGFIAGAAKPGYGCQYVLALRDVTGDAAQASCLVRVLSVTPFLFAPRVEFSQPVADVQLDGREWRYFDERLVFLPNQPGDYRLRVRYGAPDGPTLRRTYARIQTTAWNGRTLQFVARDPEWAGAPPSALFYYALARTPGGAPTTTVNAALVEQQGKQCLVRFQAGTVELGW